MVGRSVLERSLSELEGHFSVHCVEAECGLAARCAVAAQKKLRNLNAEDLRLLIGQKIGLEHLVPLALNLLEKDLLCAGALYRGDLLHSVLSVPKSYWQEFPDCHYRLVDVCADIDGLIETLTEASRRWEAIGFPKKG